MLTVINNKDNDHDVSLFNQKIAHYNKLRRDKKTSTYVLVGLLQEINYYAQTIKNSLLDSAETRLPSGSIIALSKWHEVARELSELGYPCLEGLSAEKQILDHGQNKTKYHMSKTKWDKKTHAFSIEHLKSVQSPIAHEISQILHKLEENPESNVQQFYSLKQLQNKLLHAINFNSLSKRDLKYFRKLTLEINSKLSALIENTPEIRESYTTHHLIAFELRQNLESPKTDISKLLEAFEHDDLHELKILSPYLLQKLGGTNNKNWLAIDEENGLAFTIRTERKFNNMLLS